MKRRAPRGLTLVEVMITVVIISVALLPLLRGYLGSVQGVTESLGETRALTSAETLMNKILAFAWEEPTGNGSASPPSSLLGPERAETHPALYDDIDDWNGFEDVDPARPGMKRHVRVEFINPETGETLPAFQTSDVKRIVVQVQHDGRTITLTSLRVRQP